VEAARSLPQGTTILKLVGGFGAGLGRCVRNTSRPATFSVAAREKFDAYGAISSTTVPSPAPLWPDAIVTHAAVFDADQKQVDGLATVIEAFPPAFDTVTLVGVTAYVQGAAAWLIVIVRPASVKVPVRGLVLGLAATVYVIRDAPVPEVVLGSVIHESLLDPAHVHAALVLI
jgi:hypothetical protein